MKKLIISLAVVLVIGSCKGPGTGPLVKTDFPKDGTVNSMEGPISTGMVKTEKADVSVEPAEGCIRISDLLADKKTYSGKTIKVKGQVIKYNPGIMGKNWVHIQDGTEFEKGFDLTITTDKEVSVGEIIIFEGKIVLDQDFGYGYVYPVLMEDGKRVE